MGRARRPAPAMGLRGERSCALHWSGDILALDVFAQRGLIMSNAALDLAEKGPVLCVMYTALARFARPPVFCQHLFRPCDPLLGNGLPYLAVAHPWFG